MGLHIVGVHSAIAGRASPSISAAEAALIHAPTIAEAPAAVEAATAKAAAAEAAGAASASETATASAAEAAGAATASETAAGECLIDDEQEAGCN